MGLKRTHTAPPSLPSLHEPRKMDPIAPIGTQKSSSSIKWQYQTARSSLKSNYSKTPKLRSESLVIVCCTLSRDSDCHFAALGIYSERFPRTHVVRGRLQDRFL